MEDDFSKRRREELERIARLADPLREFRNTLDPMREAKELMDPMHQVREQLEAARLEPMLRAKDELRALTEGPMKQAREQLEAARLEPMLRAQEELWALTEHPMFNAREQIAAMLGDPMEKFREQIKAITDPLAGFRDAMEQQGANFQQQLREILDPFHGARDWLKAYQEEQREQLQHWRSLLDDFSLRMAEMPARLRAQLAVLMERGWCLDPEMPHSWGVDLVNTIQEGEEEEAQQWLVDYFRQRLEEIEEKLVERHPQRAAIIAEAFAAHREERFALSIPVMLTQAEGVVHDKHQRQLFSKKNNTNLKEVLVSLPDDDTRAIFMSAFVADIPLTRSTKDLPANFDGLNRHAVLHGLDPKYGTEVNGLRALSILNLASYLVVEEENAAAA